MKTGIIEFILSGVGSKSEKMQPFLKEADGNLVEIYKEGDNPFKNESLKPYEGKTVTITGEENEYGAFIIDTINLVAAQTEAAPNNEAGTAEQKSSVDEVPVAKEITPETEEKVEEKTEEAPSAKEIPEPPLKGFKKFLAFFHRK